MNLIEEQIVCKTIKLVDSRFVETTEVTIKENAGAYNSLIAIPQNTIYRNGLTSEKLIARVKTNGKIQYISLPDTVKSILEEYNIPFTEIKSENFLRLEIDYFLSQNNEGLESAINAIFLDALNFPSFGCCARFRECSQSGTCLHPDFLYASAACQYKKHLDKGEIFYK